MQPYATEPCFQNIYIHRHDKIVLVINVNVFKFYDGQMLGGMEFRILKFRHHLVTNGAA